MFFGLFGAKNQNRVIVDRQYATLTAIAREPRFYTDLGMPDTVMGRFEMLSIVMILYFRRTRSSSRSGQEIAQEIVDAFFQDIDHSIRELGVGDHGVPKRMKKMAGMFYGRLEAYAAALDAKDEAALAQALGRNIYPEKHEGRPALHDLARWMTKADADLGAIDEDSISRGQAQLRRPGSEA
ncbi:ubiquinol-cytochrome C chaperone family protein [Neorhizobium sp. NPDC001467]|uniref:ubiquinol-cytochrome C chaperone family protein n=1 Tax=Neorhizobium sp. NPDC001467 TaxID=3390595 RepID=UPI003CFD543E